MEPPGLVRACAWRGLVAATAALALLLQVLFAAPLAARMMSEAPICGALAGDDAPAAPVIPHDHGSCLVCHAGALPVALLTVALVLGALWCVSWRADPTPPPAEHAPARRWRHAARAPPALA